MRFVGWVLVAGTVWAAGVAGCSGSTETGQGADAGHDAASGSSSSGSSSGSSGSSGSSSGASGSSGSSSGATGSSGASGSSSGAASSGSSSGGTGSSGAPADSGAEGGSDGFAASRAACVAKINALRASDTAIALQPYTLLDDAATNACVDTQVSNDQSLGSMHHSFENDAPSCNSVDAGAFYQSEGTGYGTAPAGVEQCLQDMWDESKQPSCAGCVGCAAPGGACPNCDYYGTKGYYCGDYVNLSSPDLTTVACGFSGAAPSSSTGWIAVNVQ